MQATYSRWHHNGWNNARGRDHISRQEAKEQEGVNLVTSVQALHISQRPLPLSHRQSGDHASQHVNTRRFKPFHNPCPGKTREISQNIVYEWRCYFISFLLKSGISQLVPFEAAEEKFTSKAFPLANRVSWRFCTCPWGPENAPLNSFMRIERHLTLSKFQRLARDVWSWWPEMMKTFSNFKFLTVHFNGCFKRQVLQVQSGSSEWQESHYSLSLSAHGLGEHLNSPSQGSSYTPSSMHMYGL